MTKFILVIFFFVLSITSFSQNKSLAINAGPTVSLPAYTSSFGNNHTYGIGIEANVTRSFSKHFSYKISSGFQHFTGKIETFNSENLSYNIIPVLFSLRYHYKPVFIGLETGPLVSISKSATTHNTINPSLGVNLNKLQIEVKLINVLGMASIPENSFLVSGGYGLYSITLTYSLYYKNH